MDNIVSDKDFVQRIVNCMKDGLIVFDNKGYITFINRQMEKMLEYQPGELLGKHWTVYCDRKAIERIKKEIKEKRHRGVSSTYEVSYTTKTGKKLPLFIVGSPIMKGVLFNGAIIICRDIREQHALQRSLQLSYDELRQAYKNQLEFLGNASHSLRTPLTVIRGITDVSLRNSADDPDELRKALQIVQEESAHMSKIIDDLLLLTRRQQKKTSLKKRQGQLDKLILNLVKHYMDVTDLTLFKITRLDRVKTSFDSEKVKQMLRNIIDNAIQNVPTKGGKIQISLKKDRDLAIITIRDNGRGIPKKHLPHIFDRFYRADKSAYPGSGLGLAIAQWVAEAHGGTIEVKSKYRQGATFTITLPRK